MQNIRIHSIAILCSLIWFASGSNVAFANNSKKSMEPEDFITTNRETSLVYECHPTLWNRSKLSSEIEFTLKPKKGRKRCEIAVQKALKRDEPFSLSFRFKVKDNYAYSDRWHSYFQIHSFPDKGEKWRCPIVALETRSGKLRMFNRWDHKRVSKTVDGTCASRSNSIKTRTLFKGVSYSSEKWHIFKIEGTLSNKDSACLKTYLDDQILSETCGPNTLNDEKMPFFKLGIYKPTGWDKYPEISLKIKDLELN
ncbi:heparin lyase I family protein [Vibrio penaeicida]|uniref:heparin lyase I family protein n=1 Tax=Vibrio penaeicida TaxID=104609 RepID=UPI0027377C39|nr:heparin lyase I family protein [Vibrio penaeicida]MDP2573397.1 heparin lyase I family protein [Vibrio penaeicida]